MRDYSTGVDKDKSSTIRQHIAEVLRDAPLNEDVEFELNITADRKVVDYETGHKIKLVVSGEKKQ